MGLYLYCVGLDDHPPPEGVKGLDGAEVRAVEVGGLSAWVADLDRAPAASLDHARVHNQVVEAAAQDATPLPLRFGQWFDSPAALEQSVLERRDVLEQRLRRVSGCLEFGVRIVDPDYVADEPGRESGRAYLEGLARRERQSEENRERGLAVAGEVTAWLGDLTRDTNVRPLGRDGLASIAYLVDRHNTRRYQRRIRQFPDRHPELRFLLSGPWPPYGFAE